jgi:outer membrane autotransporter protein
MTKKLLISTVLSSALISSNANAMLATIISITSSVTSSIIPYIPFSNASFPSVNNNFTNLNNIYDPNFLKYPQENRSLEKQYYRPSYVMSDLNRVGDSNADLVEMGNFSGNKKELVYNTVTYSDSDEFFDIANNSDEGFNYAPEYKDSDSEDSDSEDSDSEDSDPYSGISAEVMNNLFPEDSDSEDSDPYSGISAEVMNNLFPEDSDSDGEDTVVQRVRKVRVVKKNKVIPSEQSLENLTEKMELSEIVNSSEQDIIKLKAFIAAKVKDQNWSETRNSSTNQENLKKRIASIKAAPAKVISDERLKGLEIILDLFIDRNPVNGKDVASIQKPDNAVSEAIMGTLFDNRKLIDSRIAGFSAVAAGDIIETYGVWAKGSYTQAMQKAHGGTDGYAANQKGVTVGVDAGDETLVGLAYSFFKNDIKNKTTKANKEDITSHTISAYGKIDVTNEVFAAGQVQYGFADVKKKRATGDIDNNIATAKTKATTTAGKAEVGYNFDTKINNIHVIPTAGIAYTNVAVKGYSESGEGLNRKVGKRTVNRTSGIAGLMIRHVTTNGDMKFIPEVHANIDYAFKTKNASTKVTIIDGIAPIATPSEKLTKAHYNVGTSIKAIQADMFEISAGYDLGLAKKFKSHTGTLKVRVNL